MMLSAMVKSLDDHKTEILFGENADELIKEALSLVLILVADRKMNLQLMSDY